MKTSTGPLGDLLPRLPDLPDRTLSIADHVAVERGKTLNTQAIADANQHKT